MSRAGPLRRPDTAARGVPINRYGINLNALLHEMTPFERGLVAHLVADWLLQNDWMAHSKKDLSNPAGWVHASIHGVLLTLALGWQGGVVLGALHLIIDTGRPVNWWIRVFKKCENSPQIALIRVWTDQVVHIAAIAAWVSFRLK
jgi:hypothetical protein